jgi:predicted dehydrogenase
MKILYIDTWRTTPDPISLPGLIKVRVLSASTPGSQGNSRIGSSSVGTFVHLLQYRRKALKRAWRYSQAIGIRRTLAKVRSNVLAYQGQLEGTVASVTGIVKELHGAETLKAGSLVAGYRSGHPLYTDIILLHPEQMVEIAPEVPSEDGATVFHYAIALDACNRLSNERSSLHPVIICGATLCCFLLKQLLSDRGIDTTSFEDPGKKSVSEIQVWRKKGAVTVVGTLSWFNLLKQYVGRDNTYYLALNTEYLTSAEWIGLERNWIGLPHSELRNVNIFSGLPLEVPEYLKCEGLKMAILDMQKRAWKPSTFLTPYDTAEDEEGQTVPSNAAYSLKGRDFLGKEETVVHRKKVPSRYGKDLLRVGFIGLGMWARGNLIPFLLRNSRVRLVMSADQDQIRLHQAADLFDIPIICTDPFEICSSDSVDAVFISTWHDTHADLAAKALKAGKKVFVEKPLALGYDELGRLVSTMRGISNPFLAVGFNRVCSPLTKLIQKELSREEGPVTFTATVREPTIQRTHYYYWPHQGSRIVSNGCHWIDYAFHLLQPRMPLDIRVTPALGDRGEDNNTITIRYSDGSLVNLIFADRGESLIGGNEYIDIKTGNNQYMIHDFKACIRYQEGKSERIWKSGADRGWEQEMRDVVDGMLSGRPPRDYMEIVTSSILVLEAKYSYEKGGELRHISPDPALGFRYPPPG